MSRRIFSACFLLALALLLGAILAIGCYAHLVLDPSASMEEARIALIGPTVIIICLAVLLAALCAAFAAYAVMRPIRKLDPAHPETAAVYPELAPLLTRIGDQGKQVRAQSSELNRSRSRFETLTAHMSEGMVIIDDRAEVISCNPAARTLFGIGEGELPKNVLALRATAAFRAAVRDALAGKNGYEIWRTDEKYYSMLATPIRREGGVEGAVLMLLDVTEREERERLRREFTANISHELKTPLTSISGFAELIAAGVATEEDSRRFAENIHREAGRLITLVGDIIHLSEIDGGELPFDEEPIDLAATAAEVLSRLESIAAQAEIALSFEGEHALVRGNAGLVERMIYNLVENGIHYNRTGGYVRVRVENNGDRIALFVTDNGIGIPHEAQSRVFERFFRVDKSHSKEIGGTGLGLSIVKHAAARHGATLTLTSEVGKGTTVALYFPPLNMDLT